MVAPPPDHDLLAGPGRWSELRRIGRIGGRRGLGDLGPPLARLDTEPRLLAALRNLRRRLPGDERFGDPLSTGGPSSAAVVARGLASLRAPERESALGELGLAGLQLWQSLSELTGRGRGGRDLALMWTDLVDFSPYALAAGDTAAVELLVQVGRVVEERISARGGRIQKRLGDGLLASFPDVLAAVYAALESQDAVGEIEQEGYRPRMRVGIHWGRPRSLGGEMLGADVSVAAGVGAAARGGQVLVSAPVLEQLEQLGQLEELGRETERLRVGRRRRLRQPGAPRELLVASVRWRHADPGGKDGSRSWRALRGGRS